MNAHGTSRPEGIVSRRRFSLTPLAPIAKAGSAGIVTYGWIRGFDEMRTRLKGKEVVQTDCGWAGCRVARPFHPEDQTGHYTGAVSWRRKPDPARMARDRSGRLLIFCADEFEIRPSHQLFFQGGSGIEHDHIDIVERRELLSHSTG